MINRRSILGVSLAAVPTGIAGGFLIRHWTRGDASIRFLGRNRSMIALLDSGNERLLFMLGDPDMEMMRYLPQLLTVGRTRADVLIASHRWLTSEGARTRLDLDDIHTFSLQSTSSLPPIRGIVTPLSDTHTLKAGNQCEVTITVANEGYGGIESRENQADPGVIMEITCRETHIILANKESIIGTLPRGQHLLAVPGEIDASLITQIAPALFLGTELHTDLVIPEMQMFHNEPVNFTVNNGALTLRDNQISS